MPNNVDTLLPASFRGTPFFVDSESEPSLGRKTATHDYPNSGKRFVQDLGPKVDEFDITGKVKGPTFKQDSKNLKESLNKEGHGRLVLPNNGTVLVKVLDYSVNHPFKSIGIIEFTIKFSISNADETAADALASIQDTFQAADESRLLMQEKFVENYKVPKSRLDVLTMTEDFLFAVEQTIDKYSSQTVFDNSRLQNILFDITDNISKIIRLPETLAKKLIYGNLNALDGLFSVLSELFTIFDDDDEEVSKPSASTALAVSDFGSDFKNNGTTASTSDIPLWPNDTVNRILRNNNRTVTVETVRLNSLILAFEVAANFDYQVSSEISNVIIELEEVYNNLILIGDPQSILAKDEEIKLSIDTVKSLAYNVLEQKAQQVFSVTELKFQGVNSVVNLTYKLYKERIQNTTDLEEIAQLINDLNPVKIPLEFTGEVNAFES